MIRQRALLIVLVASLSLAVVLAGCGGDTGLAKQYCIDGDASYNKALIVGRSLTSDEQQFLRIMLNNDVAGLMALKPKLLEMTSEIDASLGDLNKAADHYNKVMRLKRPGDYAEYARLMLEATVKNKESLLMGKDLVNRVMVLVQRAESGEPLDLQSSIKTGSSDVNLLDQYVREIRGLEQEAKNLASQKDLF